MKLEFIDLLLGLLLILIVILCLVLPFWHLLE